MQLVLTHRVSQRAALLQQNGRQRYGCDPLNKCSGKYIHCEHGAEPMAVERNQPVESAYRERHSEDRNKKRGVACHAIVKKQALPWISVLPERGPAKEPGKGSP